jgi:DNA helicase IV
VDKEAVKLEEQAYFDEAYRCREAMRGRIDGFADAAAHAGAAEHMHAYQEHAHRSLRPPGSPVAFGRTDAEDGESYRVGYHAIWNDTNDILVVNWQAPIAAPYYEASVDDPKGLLRRRDFTTDGNTIVDFEDFVFAELAAEVDRLLEPREFALPDTLLEDLERHRTGEMQDIVRTIQQAQFRLVRADPDQLLVIQGGPGTGKTAVALHRVSWILFNHRDRIGPRDILVIGPNPTFIRYIQRLLPGLGDDNVRHTALIGLFGDVRYGGPEVESPEVARLKGDLRMRQLVDRGLHDRISPPTEALAFEVGARVVTISTDTVLDRLGRFRALRFTAGRQRLREFIREEVVRRAGQAPERDSQIDATLDRIWPALTPQAFLRELYGSERRLVTAAGEDFTAAEVRALYRRSVEKLSDEVWSPADAAVLDYASLAMNGPPQNRYEHVVVDEAQDLSPMELSMIARRSTSGSMTILGDVAQSVGGWARDDWTDVLASLGGDGPSNLEELQVGYRVPRQIFEFAAQLLPHIAPQVTPPTVVRDGPADPQLVHVDDDELPAAVVRVASDHAARGFQIGVVVPDSLRPQVQEAFDDAGVNWSDARLHGLTGNITLVAPVDCRGLEFDVVVVVEPEVLVTEQIHGHRLLYVALTRSTQYLIVVHAGAALPLPDRESPTAAVPVETPADATSTLSPVSRDERAVDAFASVLADEIRDSLQPNLWPLMVERIRSLLSEEGEDPNSDLP